MSMYTDKLLAFDAQRRSRADGRRIADRDGSGTLIFCGISLALALVAPWAAASGQGDISAVML